MQNESYRRRLAELLLRRGWNQKMLASKARLNPTHLNRILHGQPGGQNPNAETQARIANAFGYATREAMMSDNVEQTPQAERVLTIRDLIIQKCIEDFKYSAISDEFALKQAIDCYQYRLDRTSLYVRDLKDLKNLRDSRWALLHMYALIDRSGRSAWHPDARSGDNLIKFGVPERIKEAVRTLKRFTAREGALRVSCGILVGAIATISALGRDQRLGLDVEDIALEIEAPSGVEDMHRLATRGKGAPVDFVAVATGAYELTFVADRQQRYYHPALPLYYEEQVNLCRPSKSGVAVVPRMLDLYEGSASLQELLVRKDEFGGRLEVFRHRHFQSLAERLPHIERDVMVNVWAPISTLLVNRFRWPEPALPPYKSLIVLYQHERFSRKALEAVGWAFKEVFIYEWNCLKDSPTSAFRFLMDNRSLINMFEIGSGLQTVEQMQRLSGAE